MSTNITALWTFVDIVLQRTLASTLNGTMADAGYSGSASLALSTDYAAAATPVLSRIVLSLTTLVASISLTMGVSIAVFALALVAWGVVTHFHRTLRNYALLLGSFCGVLLTTAHAATLTHLNDRFQATGLVTTVTLGLTLCFLLTAAFARLLRRCTDAAVRTLMLSVLLLVLSALTIAAVFSFYTDLNTCFGTPCTLRSRWLIVVPPIIQMVLTALQGLSFALAGATEPVASGKTEAAAANVSTESYEETPQRRPVPAETATTMGISVIISGMYLAFTLFWLLNTNKNTFPLNAVIICFIPWLELGADFAADALLVLHELRELREFKAARRVFNRNSSNYYQEHGKSNMAVSKMWSTRDNGHAVAAGPGGNNVALLQGRERRGSLAAVIMDSRAQVGGSVTFGGSTTLGRNRRGSAGNAVRKSSSTGLDQQHFLGSSARAHSMAVPVPEMAEGNAAAETSTAKADADGDARPGMQPHIGRRRSLDAASLRQQQLMLQRIGPHL